MASPMEEFQVSIHTSPGLTSGTYSNLGIALIGSEGEPLPLSISLADQHLLPGSVSFTPSHPMSKCQEIASK